MQIAGRMPVWMTIGWILTMRCSCSCLKHPSLSHDVIVGRAPARPTIPVSMKPACNPIPGSWPAVAAGAQGRTWVRSRPWAGSEPGQDLWPWGMASQTRDWSRGRGRGRGRVHWG